MLSYSLFLFFQHNSILNFLRLYMFLQVYTSLLAIGIGVLLFLLTSFSDPGTVKAENVSQYIPAYPYNNVIYSEKECSTCKIPKWVFTWWDFFGNFHLILLIMIVSSFGSDLPGPSTATFVTAVLLALTIIVDGW